MTDEIRSFASSQRLSGTREINLVAWNPRPGERSLDLWIFSQRHGAADLY